MPRTKIQKITTTLGAALALFPSATMLLNVSADTTDIDQKISKLEQQQKSDTDKISSLSKEIVARKKNIR